MRIATWNINHRAGQFFNLEAAEATCALDADLVALTEFAPAREQDEAAFRARLAGGGLVYQVVSDRPPAGTRGNRVLVASRLPIVPLALQFPPELDVHVPSNTTAVFVPSLGLTIIAMRVPYYNGAQARALTMQCWEWLSTAAAAYASVPCILMGDLNVAETSPASRGAGYFRDMLSSGWSKISAGPTFPDGLGGGRQIDHIMSTRSCALDDPVALLEAGAHRLAGSSAAISDHAALLCTVSIASAACAGMAEGSFGCAL